MPSHRPAGRPPAAGSVRRWSTTTSSSTRPPRRWSFRRSSFRPGDPAVAIVASLATYGVGYVARPVGAFVLGHWGDTHGRRHVLVFCMVLMGVSTTAVGLLPTYEQAGVLAPALLVALRLIQGFAVAGEISGSSSMILEHAPFGRRGLYASFSLQGVQAGRFSPPPSSFRWRASCHGTAFMAWGWRVPFLLSLLAVAAGYVIRRRVRGNAGLRGRARPRAHAARTDRAGLCRARRPTCCASPACR